MAPRPPNRYLAAAALRANRRDVFTNNNGYHRVGVEFYQFRARTHITAVLMRTRFGRGRPTECCTRSHVAPFPRCCEARRPSTSPSVPYRVRALSSTAKRCRANRDRPVSAVMYNPYRIRQVRRSLLFGSATLLVLLLAATPVRGKCPFVRWPRPSCPHTYVSDRIRCPALAVPAIYTLVRLLPTISNPPVLFTTIVTTAYVGYSYLCFLYKRSSLMN